MLQEQQEQQHQQTTTTTAAAVAAAATTTAVAAATTSTTTAAVAAERGSISLPAALDVLTSRSGDVTVAAAAPEVILYLLERTRQSDYSETH